MYTPAHFAEARPSELHRLIRQHPLGVLVTTTPQGLDANHLPFELEAEPAPGRLIGHVARANPVWQQVASGTPVLVVFRGVQGYVSPNGYPSKADTHRAVPTWNYEAVHVHGTLHVHDDARFVRGVVARLTRTHEAAEPQPWKMGDAPADYLDAMVANIVGIEVRITRLEGKRKLSQNRDAADRLGAAAHARGRGLADLADAMRDIAE
ncbi:FMN-binding negative transcriptional regulator [Ideonella sp.]|uniref:FMN-binding negative transcriptional regulator n=1 Tax=Ideonella sp. TaxID=1929293 RepID=UPI0035ADD729